MTLIEVKNRAKRMRQIARLLLIAATCKVLADLSLLTQRSRQSRGAFPIGPAALLFRAVGSCLPRNERGADMNCRPLFHRNQRGIEEGQVSIPEQNASVKEHAGPSQPLLPASSKAASGSSKLRASSS
jgi:hypothetical protein